MDKDREKMDINQDIKAHMKQKLIKVVGVRCTIEEWEMLNTLSNRTKRSLSQTVRVAISEMYKREIEVGEREMSNV